MTQATQETVMSRVLKLLAKAESTEFEAEAEALVAKAHELQTRHAIEQAQLDEFRRRSGQTSLLPEPQDEILVFSGNKMHVLQKRLLFHVVAVTNRCDSVFLSESYGQTEQRAHLFGFKEDMEFVKILYTSLLVQMNREADRALKRARTEREIKNGYAWKRNFFIGFATAVHTRMQVQTRKIVADVEAKSTGTELLLADRTLAVKQRKQDHYPHLRAGSSQRVSNRDSYRSGSDAGRRADISGGRRGSQPGGLKEIG